MYKEAMNHEGGGYDKGDDDFQRFNHMAFRTFEVECVEVEEAVDESEEEEGGGEA
jgi:hypothetical protein